MSKVALNKSSLSKEKKRRSAFHRYLPSLEMKQKQLLGERKKLEKSLAEVKEDLQAQRQAMSQRFPMLASETFNLHSLVVVRDFTLRQETFLGLTVPVLEKIEFDRQQYGYFARPHWFDALQVALEKCIRSELEYELLAIRLAIVKKAVKTITQRVNLFSKVLIPETTANIKRIGLFIADQERASVVRSKISKEKHG